MVNTNVCHAEVFAHQVIGHTNTGPAFPKPFSAAPPAVSTTIVLTTVNDYLKGNIVTPKKFSLFFSTVTQLKAVPGFQQLHAPHVGHHCTRTWKHSDSVLFRSNSTIAIKLKNHQEDGFSAAPAIRETNKPKSRVVFCFVFYSKIIESRKNKLDLENTEEQPRGGNKILTDFFFRCVVNMWPQIYNNRTGTKKLSLCRELSHGNN